MDAGLGGANGFQVRTRREEDAKAFVQEWTGRPRSRKVGPVAIGLVLAAVAVLLVLGLLGMG